MKSKKSIPCVMNPYKKVFSYKQAVAFLKQFQLKSFREYQKKYKRLSSRLHSNPNVRYRKEWIGWQEYLSLQRHSRLKRHIFSYEEARKFVKKQHIKTREEYVKRYKTLSPNLPSDPNIAYREHWTKWPDFLAERPTRFSYQEAVAFLKEKKIKSVREYKKNHKKLSPRLVYNAPRVYGKEWTNWGSYLSKPGSQKRKSGL